MGDKTCRSAYDLSVVDCFRLVYSSKHVDTAGAVQEFKLNLVCRASVLSAQLQCPTAVTGQEPLLVVNVLWPGL